MKAIKRILVSDHPLNYDPVTGEFTRGGKRSGSISVSGTRKYRIVVPNMGSKRVHAHRVAWEMVNGPIPHGMVIDHINGDTMDNRIANLRLATPAENARNVRMSKANTSGYRGVYFCGYTTKNEPRWQTWLYVNRKKRSLGQYPTAKQASEVHEAARKQHFGEFYSEPSVT